MNKAPIYEIINRFFSKKSKPANKQFSFVRRFIIYQGRYQGSFDRVIV